ncbi:putative membrane protein [Tistlia consotensis]|uniref:Putative membrane protein n=1 Tax=Tistlia consotensis USBA 355 TaxID=560819 RepID=A0A1Y6B695_9PROT|nr:lysylphosphatidylglycerol synthase domain-containing protein [Tistlia consotensis]SME94343.1 putative membrane protein [Tistlia consotensis USBA 355]SNR29280.1 putative membrane protein [Tistlia consotensis]
MATETEGGPGPARDRRARRIRLGIGLTALAGLLVAIALIAGQGVAAVTGAVLGLGWGLLWTSLFHLVPMVFSTLGWWVLQPSPRLGGPLLFFWTRWIREAVDALLPLGQLGSGLVGARILSLHGATPRDEKGAAIGGTMGGAVVDMTLEGITQVPFTLLGIALLAVRHGYDERIGWMVVGVGVAVVLLAGLVLAQRGGLFALLERGLELIARRTGWQALGRTQGLHDAIALLHRDRRRLTAGFLLHSLSWLFGAGETWLALWFMGRPADLVDALILESLGAAVRSAAFAIPGGLGAQEGGYLLVAGMLGLDPGTGLALSLVKRVRDLLLGLPALAAWQVVEGRHLLRRGAETGGRDS